MEREKRIENNYQMLRKGYIKCWKIHLDRRYHINTHGGWEHNLERSYENVTS